MKRIIKATSIIISVLLILTCFSACEERLENDSWQIAVPDISGKTYEEAMQILAQSGLNCLITARIKDDTVADECVLSFEPEAGEIVNKGTAVKLVLSAGGNKIYVPDLSYYKKEVAVEVMKELGVNTKIIESDSMESNPYVAPGAVSWSVPDPGKSVNRGGTVSLRIRTNAPADVDKTNMVEVPSLIGNDYFEMVRVLADNKVFLSISDVSEGEYSDKNKILTQSEFSGTKVPEGTIIYVTVCTGGDRMIVPDVEFMKQENAEDTLAREGLKAQVTYSDSDLAEKGVVIEQSKRAGKDAKEGEVIGIVVSTGGKTEIPDVKGQEERLAVSTLVDSKLEVEVVYVKTDSVRNGRVAAQSIKAGESVDIGTAVTVYVSSKKADNNLSYYLD